LERILSFDLNKDLGLEKKRRFRFGERKQRFWVWVWILKKGEGN